MTFNFSSGQPTSPVQTSGFGGRTTTTLVTATEPYMPEPYSGILFNTTNNTRPRSGFGLFRSTTPETMPSGLKVSCMAGQGQAKKQAKDLKATQHELFNKEKYSDLTVKCKSREWKCHRAILCPRCPFFEAACGGQFTEATSHEVDLSDDDETALGIMLQYLYTYEIFNHGLPTATSFQLLILGDKYELEDLRDTGLHNLTTEIANLTSHDGSWVAEWYPQICQLQQTGTQALKLQLSNAIAKHAREMIRNDGMRDLIANDGALAVLLVEKLATPAPAMFATSSRGASSSAEWFRAPGAQLAFAAAAASPSNAATFGSGSSPTISL